MDSTMLLKDRFISGGVYPGFPKKWKYVFLSIIPKSVIAGINGYRTAQNFSEDPNVSP